jgi:hypothetical protein
VVEFGHARCRIDSREEASHLDIAIYVKGAGLQRSVDSRRRKCKVGDGSVT